MTEENKQDTPQQPTSSTPKVVPAFTKETDTKSVSTLREYVSIFAIIMMGVVAMGPALAITGFMPMSFIDSTTTASLIALIGGAIGGALSQTSTKFSVMGMILGATYCICALWLTIFYTQSRSSIFRFELAIPFLLAILPTAVLYAILNKVMGKNDKPSL